MLKLFKSYLNMRNVLSKVTDKDLNKIYLKYRNVKKIRHFHFEGCAISDIGYKRSNNEDNYILDENINANCNARSKTIVTALPKNGEWQCAGVFDGMGGGEMGELASKNAANCFSDAFKYIMDECSQSDIDKIIRSAFLEANNKIISLQKQYNILGTTGTVLCTNGFVFKIYHLGDSRGYLFRDKKLFQLTKDQTLGQMKQDSGFNMGNGYISESDNHKLTDYIGRDFTCKNIKPIESNWNLVEQQDYIILCSDGLYDMCSDENISTILLEENSVNEKTAKLVKKALNNGGLDNITCVIIHLN